MKYPKGYRKTDGNIQLAVRFPHAVFDQIIAMAKKEKPQKDFNEMVVYLVKCGKLCLEESDRLEPKKAA